VESREGTESSQQITGREKSFGVANEILGKERSNKEGQKAFS
jgi:hypothetical protein